MVKDAQLDTLNQVFHSLSDQGAMSLSEYDGFVAGLLVCPKMIMPSECTSLRDWQTTAQPLRSATLVA